MTTTTAPAPCQLWTHRFHTERTIELLAPDTAHVDAWAYEEAPGVHCIVSTAELFAHWQPAEEGTA